MNQKFTFSLLLLFLLVLLLLFYCMLNNLHQIAVPNIHQMLNDKTLSIYLMVMECMDVLYDIFDEFYVIFGFCADSSSFLNKIHKRKPLLIYLFPLLKKEW